MKTKGHFPHTHQRPSHQHQCSENHQGARPVSDRWQHVKNEDRQRHELNHHQCRSKTSGRLKARTRFTHGGTLTACIEDAITKV